VLHVRRHEQRDVRQLLERVELHGLLHGRADRRNDAADPVLLHPVADAFPRITVGGQETAADARDHELCDLLPECQAGKRGRDPLRVGLGGWLR
jgi:hypothetical protein